MAGVPGNPNHDPKTGRFASKSGLNKSNSTVGQRGKAAVKEHISAAKAFAGAAAVAAVGAVGAAVLQGITRPVRVHATVAANNAIIAATGHAERLAAAHGPKIASAIAAKGSSLLNHVKNMKSAGAIQHSSPSPAYSAKVHDTSLAKPRVRVSMGSVSSSVKPKVRVPMRRK